MIFSRNGGLGAATFLGKYIRCSKGRIDIMSEADNGSKTCINDYMYKQESMTGGSSWTVEGLRDWEVGDFTAGKIGSD